MGREICPIPSHCVPSLSGEWDTSAENGTPGVSRVVSVVRHRGSKVAQPQGLSVVGRGASGAAPYRLGPELPRRVRPRPISGKMCQIVPFCATPYLSGPHRGTKCHTGVSRHPVDSGGIGLATRFDARGLDLSAGECLSRGQSSTDVLPGSMASTKNRKALAQPSFPRRARPVETGRRPLRNPSRGSPTQRISVDFGS